MAQHHLRHFCSDINIIIIHKINENTLSIKWKLVCCLVSWLASCLFVCLVCERIGLSFSGFSVRAFILFVCLFVCLLLFPDAYAFLFVCGKYMFVCLFVCLFDCLFVCLFACLFVCLFFIYLFVCLFACLFVCLFVYLFIYLFVGYNCRISPIIRWVPTSQTIRFGTNESEPNTRHQFVRGERS